MREQYWINEEPTQLNYSQLIDFCARRCLRFSLAMQRPRQFSSLCYEFLDKLEDNLIEKRKQTEWPGTKLTRTEACVYWYRVNRSLVDQIKNATNGLYEWSVPDLPEDPAFYYPDDGALLRTSSHERFAFIILDHSDFEAFQKEVPNVHLTRESLHKCSGSDINR
jgi:hypothetical protein